MSKITKDQVSEILKEIAVLLELTGENVFKARAYYNASRAIEGLTEDIETLIKEKRLNKIKGVGKSIAQKIITLYESGRLPYYEELKSKVPPGLIEMLKIPGLGPKRIKALYDKLGIQSIGELEYACKENRLVELDGFGSKIQENILQGIEFVRKYQSRFHINVAYETKEKLLTYLKELKGIDIIEVAGSLRRFKETIKDIDILITTTLKDTEKIMDYFTSYPEIMNIIGKGATKSSIRLNNGMQVDLRVVADKEFPYALMYFTGSKEHNIAMRGLAQKLGYKLNEYGLFKNGNLILCKTEAEVFQKLGLVYIPPELRENMGEIEAAMNNDLPELIEFNDIKGIFHFHTVYSDGSNNFEEIIKYAKAKGYKYLGVADHSKTAGYAHGLSEEEIYRQWEEIDNWNAKIGEPYIFKGIESDILLDGSLDYPDKILEKFDFVIGSIHSSFNLTEEEMTKRVLRAMENPNFTMLGHPTGRLLLSREPYKINMDAILEEASKRNIIIELNCHPFRLDIDWRLLKRAKEMGIMISINPDAHNIYDFEYIFYGVGIARKGWIEKKDVLNAYPLKKVKKLLKMRK